MGEDIGPLAKDGKQALRSAPAASAPSPKRQLLMYVAQVRGAGALGAAVYARGGTAEAWRLVGRVVAGDSESADERLDALSAAAQLQRRLIVEHGCRLYPALRPAKRAGAVELGIQLAGEQIRAVPPAAPGDALPEQLLHCGFLGALAAAEPEVDGVEPSARPMKGLYTDFARDGESQLPYDRAAVRAEIQALLSEEGLLIFAWKNSGFARSARAALDDVGLPYRDVVLEKFSPLHAELALLTGRTTVPYVYDSGRLLGGYNADGDYPGLQGSLDRLRRAYPQIPP